LIESTFSQVGLRVSPYTNFMSRQNYPLF